jgi:small nuclear ribonucleoprotein (snRNP)-like protein
LTSASLIRNSGDENNIVENLRVSAHYSAIACSFKVLLKSHHLYHFQIEVLLPSSTERINGTLEHYDLHYNVALVSVKNHYDLRPANTLPSRPKWCSDVAAVGRCFESSALMAMSGKLISSRSALDCLYLVHSSCKITKVIICFCIAYFFMVKDVLPYLPLEILQFLICHQVYLRFLSCHYCVQNLLTVLFGI